MNFSESRQNREKSKNRFSPPPLKPFPSPANGDPQIHRSHTLGSHSHTPGSRSHTPGSHSHTPGQWLTPDVQARQGSGSACRHTSVEVPLDPEVLPAPCIKLHLCIYVCVCVCAPVSIFCAFRSAWPCSADVSVLHHDEKMCRVCVCVSSAALVEVCQVTGGRERWH